MFETIRKLFSAEPELPAAPPPGRNEPCSCGSGKKYKACCMKNGSRRGLR